VAEHIPGSNLYVTHEKMNSYLTALLGGAAAMVLSVISATWFLNDRIGELRQDVEVIKVRIESLRPVTDGSGDTTQAQYVLVEMPGHSDRGQMIREILAKQGHFNGTP